MAAVQDPTTGIYWDAETAEDAHYIRCGRRDLAPGCRYLGYTKPDEVRQPEPKPVSRGTLDPTTGLRWEANSAEDAWLISLGRRDLAPGCRLAND